MAFPPRPDDLRRDDGTVVVPERAVAALTRIITIGVQEGRRRHDPTINEDMVTLLDSIISEREWVSSANGTMTGGEARLDIAGETFTVPVAAARLGCSPRTLTKAIGEHRLRATKVGRDWHITLPDLNNYRFGARHGNTRNDRDP